MSSFLRSWLRFPSFWWFAVFVWACVLWYLSSRTLDVKMPEVPNQDKILHFLYFAAGTTCFLIARTGSKSTLPAKSWFLWAGGLFSAILGALDEHHQTYTPGRSGHDLADLLADITGGLAAAWFVWLLLRFLFSAPEKEASA